MRHIQPRGELEGLRHRFPRVCVLVQGSLGAREGEPGARALGILRDQLLAEGELAGQVVVEALPRHLDLEPLGFRRTGRVLLGERQDRKSTRLNSSHGYISYAVFCLKKKKKTQNDR